MTDLERPHLDRRSHQKVVQRRRRRMRRRRQARVRKLKFFRGLRTARFWSRAATTFILAISIAFWAKFAFVYDIPDYAQQGVLTNVSAYVSVKTWWFGPPAFDLGSYAPHLETGANSLSPYNLLVMGLGRYASILKTPDVVWTEHPTAEHP